MRLDLFLVENGFFASRQLAKYNIQKGNVLVNGVKVLKSSVNVEEADRVTLEQENVMQYVSRGGVKLEKALNEFGIDCTGLDVVDVGASTGGFTHCVLEHGALRVLAVDVGTNQLVESLRNNSKVTSLEGVSVKDIHSQSFSPSKFHLLVADLSFISLAKVVENFKSLLLPQGVVVVLIKPQFEVGPQLVGKGGVVKSAQAHGLAIANVVHAFEKEGLFLKQLTWAPIVDVAKNIEYLGYFVQHKVETPNIEDMVNLAFSERNSI